MATPKTKDAKKATKNAALSDEQKQVIARAAQMTPAEKKAFPITDVTHTITRAPVTPQVKRHDQRVLSIAARHVAPEHLRHASTDYVEHYLSLQPDARANENDATQDLFFQKWANEFPHKSRRQDAVPEKKTGYRWTT